MNFKFSSRFTKHTDTYRQKPTSILLNGKILHSSFKSEVIIMTFFFNIMSRIAKAVKTKRKRLDLGGKVKKIGKEKF